MTTSQQPTPRERQILDAYRDWRDDPSDKRSSDELGASLGVTRQRIYSVLRKYDERLSIGRGSVEYPAGIEDIMAREALGAILQQLYEARRELEEYRKKYGPLD